MSLTLGYEPADPPPPKKNYRGCVHFFRIYVYCFPKNVLKGKPVFFRSYSCQKTQKRDFEHIHKKTNFDKLNIA